MTENERTDPTTVAVFDRFEDAERAVGALTELGVAPDRLSVVTPEPQPTIDEDVEQVGGSVVERRIPGVVAGGGIGAVLGGLTAVAGLASTGGALLVAGPFLVTFAGGIGGGLVGLMTSRGIEPDVADYYDNSVRGGATLVAVEPPADASQPSTRQVERALTERGARFREIPESAV